MPEEAPYDPGREGFRSEEDLAEHRRRVPGIFGDTDTSGTAQPGTEVPSKDDEAASQAVAEVQAAQEEDVDEADDVSVAEARRQEDTATTTDVVEAAEADEADESEVTEEQDEPTAAEQVAEAEEADQARAEELSQSEYKTVRDAADKRLKELSDE